VPSSWPHRYCRPECRPTLKPEDRAAYAREWRLRRGEAEPEVVLFGRARQAAHRAGVEFLLSPKDVLVPPICPVLGIPLEFKRGRRGGARNTPTVIRVDRKQGYIPGNVMVVSCGAARSRRRGRRRALTQAQKLTGLVLTRQDVAAYHAWREDEAGHRGMLAP
jgi:hypothetical protein